MIGCIRSRCDETRLTFEHEDAAAGSDRHLPRLVEVSAA